MNPTIGKIQNLLRTETSVVARSCERIFLLGRPSLMSFEIPLKNAQDVYLRRAALNADRGYPIKGFDELAAALRVEMTPRVAIHTVEVASEQFSAFTTPDLSRLIGILLFPTKTSSIRDLIVRGQFL